LSIKKEWGEGEESQTYQNSLGLWMKKKRNTAGGQPEKCRRNHRGQKFLTTGKGVSRDAIAEWGGAGKRLGKKLGKSNS